MNKTYYRNQLVFREGEDPNEIHIIQSGEFKLTREEKGNSILKTFEIALLGPGELFGEEDIIE
jgi:CRP-like cAMP-binding protein